MLKKFLKFIGFSTLAFLGGFLVAQAARVGVQSVSGYFTTASNGTDIYYNGGGVGIGTSAINSTGLSIKGVSTTTSANIFEVASSTGTNIFTVGQGGDVKIGTTTAQASSFQASFTVNGPINDLWRHKECNTALIATIVSTDTSNICDGFFLDNTGASWISRADSSGSAVANGLHMQPGNQIGSGFSAVNDNIYLEGDQSMRLDQNTPVMDTILRPVSMTTASSSVYRIGFGSRALGLTTQPAAGCMFVASTTIATGNWVALCSTVLTSITMVDTGIASSSNVTGTGVYRRFRIETYANKALFYIGSGTSGLTLVATITTNVPTTTQVGPIIGIIKESAGQSPQLQIQKLDVWDQPYF